MDAFNKYFMNVVKNHYFDFDGKTSRKDYWMYVLFLFIIFIPLFIVDNLIGMSSVVTNGIGLFTGIFVLATFLPGLGITARRYHDAGWSGWWQLVGVVPLIGLATLILALLPHDPHSKY